MSMGMPTQQHEMKFKVQDRIKMMMKNKKLQKLASQKDGYSQSQPSIASHGRNINKNHAESDLGLLRDNQPSGNSYLISMSNKRMKSTTGDETDNQVKSVGNALSTVNKKFTLSKVATVFDEDAESSHGLQRMKKTPSLEKLQPRQSNTRSKRPSSVLNKTPSRSTTSRTRKHKNTSADQEKMIQDKIRKGINQAFNYGIKLEKFLDQKGLNKQKQMQAIYNQEVTILLLISTCRKYFKKEEQNQEQISQAFANSIERQVISIIKKRFQKQAVIYNCEQMTDRISQLIQERLHKLNSQQAKS